MRHTGHLHLYMTCTLAVAIWRALYAIELECGRMRRCTQARRFLWTEAFFLSFVCLSAVASAKNILWCRGSITKENTGYPGRIQRRWNSHKPRVGPRNDYGEAAPAAGRLFLSIRFTSIESNKIAAIAQDQRNVYEYWPVFKLRSFGCALVHGSNQGRGQIYTEQNVWRLSQSPRAAAVSSVLTQRSIQKLICADKNHRYSKDIPVIKTRNFRAPAIAI